MIRTLLLFLLLSPVGFAQAPSSIGGPEGAQQVFNGFLYANAFGAWSVPQGDIGQFTWSNPNICTNLSGVTFKLFSVGLPIVIVDADPTQSENTTVTAVNILPFQCSITTAPLTHTHFSFRITSATFGLQEAINYAKQQNITTTVFVTPSWTRLGGTTGMITSAVGNANIGITDQRNTLYKAYAWNGSAYVQQGLGGFGITNIDGVPIGQSVPSTGAFTTLSATGNTSLTGTDSGNQTVSGNKNYTGSAPITVTGDNPVALGGSLSAKRIEGCRQLDNPAFTSGSVTGGIQEAINDLPAGGGCIQQPANTTSTITATINVNKPNVHLVGGGYSSVISVNLAGDVFNITQGSFELKDFHVVYAYALTRSGSAFLKIGASVGLIQNVQVSGNSTTPTNGTFFYQSGTNGAWTTRDLFFFESAIVWDTIFTIQNNSASVTAASYFNYSLIGGGECLTACILLDGALDTIQFTGGGLDGLVGTSGPTVWVRNTVGGFIDPRWVHFEAFSLEGGGNTGQTVLQIDNCRDCQFSKYIASGKKGVVIGANALGTNIHDTVFINIGQDGIDLLSGASFTNIHNNYFDDTANSANNTYDTINVATSGGFVISGNTWRNVNGISHPRYGINLTSSVNATFSVIGNSLTPGGSFGTAPINDASLVNSRDKAVFGNGGSGLVPNSPFVMPAGTAANPGLIAFTDSSTGLYQFAAGDFVFSASAAKQWLIGPNIFRLNSTQFHMFSSGDPTTNQGDVGSCRVGANEVAFTTSESVCTGTAQADMTTLKLLSTLFASLGAPPNGTLKYCSDCTVANPCAGSGTGALAKRLNGAWVCN